MAKAKRYSTSQIKIFLDILKNNDYNYHKTEKETGIHRMTIKRWADSPEGQEILGVCLTPKKSKLEGVPELEPDGQIIDKNRFARNCEKVKGDILQRITDLVPVCRSVDELSRALKIIQEVQVLNENGDIPNLLNDTQKFVQIINNQIIQNTTNNQVINTIPEEDEQQD